MGSVNRCASLFQPYFEAAPTFDPHATEFIVLHFDTGSGRSIPMTAHLLSSTFDTNSSYLTLSLSRGGWGHFDKFAVFSRIRPHLARAIVVDPISTVSRSEIRWVELVGARNAHGRKRAAQSPNPEIEYVGRLPNGVLVRVLTVIEK